MLCLRLVMSLLVVWLSISSSTSVEFFFACALTAYPLGLVYDSNMIQIGTRAESWLSRSTTFFHDLLLSFLIVYCPSPIARLVLYGFSAGVWAGDGCFACV